MVLNVYKPKGWTSFDVVAKLRGILKTKKIGHAGTLDPLAEGVLVVLTDKDTKCQNEFMHTTKEYIAGVAFGATSASYDLEQPLVVTATTSFPLTLDLSLDVLRERLLKVLPDFIGEIDQQVPLYSAVKVGGKPLYKQIATFQDDPPKKCVHIYSIDVVDAFPLELQPRIILQNFVLKVTCSSGTYIRSLAHDIGIKLGTGGVMTSLLRTKVGNFYVEDSKQLSEIQLQSN